MSTGSGNAPGSPRGGGELLFPGFTSRHGAPANPEFRTITPESLPQGFPQPMLDLWSRAGFGCYSDGLIWTQPPSDLAAVIEEWTNLPPTKAALIARFSFGDFAFWAGGRIFFLNVHRGRLEELPSDVEFLFEELLADDEFLENFLRLKLHRQCSGELGLLTAEECFGFVPALALGGTESVGSVAKVRLREHLAILAQVNGPVPLA